MTHREDTLETNRGGLRLIVGGGQFNVWQLERNAFQMGKWGELICRFKKGGEEKKNLWHGSLV